MRIHILSDLHLESSDYEPRTVDCDVVALAGDVGNHDQGIHWARSTFPDKEVIYVPGNHEFYGLDRRQALDEMRSTALSLRVHLLDNDEVVIDGVRFLGASLWTDFQLFGKERLPQAMHEGKFYLNDFSMIEEEGELFTPAKSIELHKKSIHWLSKKFKEGHTGKTVAISHHLPSMLSVSERYKQSLLSACFASNLDCLIGHSTLWIHGHTHDSVDNEINGTRVVCNPRGYSRYEDGPENHDFDPSLVVEI